MATLTYNPNEQAEGELNAEEQEALAVGEQLAEQQNQLLAGKFKDAEDLEQGYIELQKKLGAPNEETAEPEEKPEAKEEKEDKVDTTFLNTLWEEAKGGEYKEETLKQLAGMDSREIAQMYLKDRSERVDTPESEGLSEAHVGQLKGVVGGEKGYNDMMQWAGQNLTENEVKMYDNVMDQGNPLAAYFAVQALAYRYTDAKGVDGEMLTGKAAKSEGALFRSQAEVVKAMSDSRYEKDPAYRQDIYDKLERSNLQF